MCKNVLCRMLPKIDFSGDCWIWQGPVNKKGYGWTWNGKSAHAHREMYHIFNGPIPDGLFVLHHCDTPGCVNPKHLFLGTAKDNIQDCIRKGRFSYNNQRMFSAGEGNTCARFTEAIINDIRTRRAKGERNIDLAEKYTTSPSVISRIVKRHSWKHI